MRTLAILIGALLAIPLCGQVLLPHRHAAGGGGGGGTPTSPCTNFLVGPSTSFSTPWEYWRMDSLDTDPGNGGLPANLGLVSGRFLDYNNGGCANDIVLTNGIVTNSWKIAEASSIGNYTDNSSSSWDLARYSWCVRYWAKWDLDAVNSGGRRIEGLFNNGITSWAIYVGYDPGSFTTATNQAFVELASGAIYDVVIGPSATLSTNTWHYFAAWHDQSTQTMGFMVDGVLVGTASITCDSSNNQGFWDFYPANVFSGCFVGIHQWLDEVVIWKGYVPTITELQNDYTLHKTYPLSP